MISGVEKISQMPKWPQTKPIKRCQYCHEGDYCNDFTIGVLKFESINDGNSIVPAPKRLAEKRFWRWDQIQSAPEEVVDFFLNHHSS